jgi:hypothetical protein
VNTVRRLHLRAPQTAPASAIVLLAVALAWPGARVHAQVVSEGKGLLTLEMGQGSAPVGGIASQVANPGTPGMRDVAHAFAFRFMAGYQFASYMSVEVGLGRFAKMNSSAPYAGGDTLIVQSALVIIEADVVGHFPLTPSSRLDLSLGITDTGLATTLSTRNGSALPIGQTASDHAHRVGATTGVDLEWRLGSVSSLIVGYHLYPHVGSSVLRDSTSGTAKAILGGVKFEF